MSSGIRYIDLIAELVDNNMGDIANKIRNECVDDTACITCGICNERCIYYCNILVYECGHVCHNTSYCRTALTDMTVEKVCPVCGLSSATGDSKTVQVVHI